MKPLRVLIVDDENRLREALARAIASWGFEVAGAPTAGEAMKLMAAQAFDISVLDLNLPGTGGIELLQKIRQISPTQQVIILTGFGDLESARAAIHLDVVDFLTKPCHLGDLERSLARAAERARKSPLSAQASPATAKAPETSETLEDLERRHILEALARNSGNRTATALELGISRRTLQYKISEYQSRGIDVD